MSNKKSNITLSSTGGGVDASQTISLKQKCQNVILQSACLPSIRQNILVPILDYLANEAEPRISLKDDSIKVMWHVLRQGALLCELVNQCQPGVIPSVFFPIAPMGPTNFTDTTSRQNVAAFIKMSRDMFFYTDEVLFNPGDLYKDDFNALTKAVALCHKYLENKIRVSPRNSYRVSDLVFEPEIAPLFSVTNTNISAVSDSAPPAASEGSKTKRERILEEMIASERVYVDDLDRLNKFKETIRFFKLLPPVEIDAIFSNLKDLLNFQRKFMIEMENENQKDQPDFASLFTAHEADFSLYEQFVLNQPTSLATLARNRSILESRPDLSENLAGNVQGYLIKPVQRVPRYYLFMRDLIKEAQKNGSEGEARNFEEAAESAKRIANRINERQRAAENEQNSREFFEHFNPVVMSPEKTGKLVLFENAMRLRLDGQLKVYKVYLFQKKLIMCAEKKEKIAGLFWIKNKVSTNTIKEVKDLKCPEIETPLEAEITCSISENDVTFSLLFRTKQTQRMWIRAIRSLADLAPLEFNDDAEEFPFEVKDEQVQSVKDVIAPKIPVPVLRKCRVRFNYRDEYFALVISDFNISRLDLAKLVRNELERALRLEFESVNEIPPLDRIRLRYKDSDGTIVRLSSDELAGHLLCECENSFLDLIVYEGDPVRVRFMYRECLYTFTVDDISALEELKMYIYETIIEDYRMINANSEAVPKGDAMRLFFKESDGQWTLLLYDNDLDVALKISKRSIDIKLH